MSPPDRDLAALSIGSGDEPQYRLLDATFRDGLCLYDIDEQALAVVRSRIERQMLESVSLCTGDYTRDFCDPQTAAKTLQHKIAHDPFDLVTLHHCLYYCDVADWPGYIEAIYRSVLAPSGAMHLAMMSTRENRKGTTTWLYNHFAAKFFDAKTDNDLLILRDTLIGHPSFKGADISSETHEVHFWVDNFERYMSVVWMILLYPDGHRYDIDQRVEIIEFIIEHFWRPQRPLVQSQDYLTVFKPG
ncbi:MAG: class I SAM-dependent methyltransferase [Hyphomicrobiales bacterium]|nr:class I SAM-dependent methyltransferase [Hyphomicrobiales bacterium]MCP5000152.1 class I SAM-dependent methyltransferase [Hyphomicrobiales bacterium]